MPQTKTNNTTTARAGFTLIELLASIAIIVLLIGIVIVAYSSLVGNAKTQASRAAVNALTQGVEAFKLDFNGKVPPLVTRPPRAPGGGVGAVQPRAFTVPGIFQDPVARAQEARDAGYYSEWSLGVYLLGEGDINGDGTTTYTTPGNPADNRDDGVDGPGFRDPGQFLSWKRFDDAGNLIHEPATTGRTYGPYIEGGAEDYLETVVVNNARMTRFVDAWGNPIRYYTGFQSVDPATGLKSSLFMPQELRSVRSAETLASRYAGGLPTGADLQSFTALDSATLNAEYVILAANDDPTRFLDIDGQSVAPFGDVGLDVDGRRTDFSLPGNFVSGMGPQPFDTSRITGDDYVADNYIEMLRTNIRSTP